MDLSSAGAIWRDNGRGAVVNLSHHVTWVGGAPLEQRLPTLSYPSHGDDA